MADVLGYLKDLVIDRPRQYWVDEPNKIAYDAQKRAAKEFNIDDTEWNKSDAVKHMVWQNELTRRMMLPQSVGGKISNLIGAFKEMGDQSFLRGENRMNSGMDMINNYYGARVLPTEGDSAAAAIEAIRNAPKKSMREALFEGLPYARD